MQQQRISDLELQQQLTATEAVLKGEEQERTRIAKDLHDGLGGMLSGIKYSLGNMRDTIIPGSDGQLALERNMDMLDSSVEEMRRLAHNMMPETLVKFGLDTALSDFCNNVNQSGALQVSYQSFKIENLQLDQVRAVALYRVVQELVNNTMKHAAAKSAVVQVSRTGDVLSVTVEDDGKGFNPKLLQQGNGMGWANIHNRIEFLKGILDVKSEPRKGTSVHFEVPL
jgi:two-component system, NarL family, sensor kinase